jgi:hypothetical protein
MADGLTSSLESYLVRPFVRIRGETGILGTMPSTTSATAPTRAVERRRLDHLYPQARSRTSRHARKTTLMDVHCGSSMSGSQDLSSTFLPGSNPAPGGRRKLEDHLDPVIQPGDLLPSTSESASWASSPTSRRCLRASPGETEAPRVCEVLRAVAASRRDHSGGASPESWATSSRNDRKARHRRGSSLGHPHARATGSRRGAWVS